MKRLGLLALLLVNSSAHAVNPVQAWYGGILLGINYTPTTYFTFPTTFTFPSSFVPPAPLPAVIPPEVAITLHYGTMGQLAGQVGYRCDKYRLEGQIGYNNSPYSSLQINSLKLASTGTHPYYNFQGATSTAFGMINGYYDFLPSDPESNLAPFVGLGIGYAYTQNSIKMDFYYDKDSMGNPVPGYEVQSLNNSRSTSSPAGQVMIGASYFLDDFTSFALDLRYFTTQKKSKIMHARVEVASINLTFNGAFNAG